MPQIPKDLTQNFFPGLADQHVIGAAGLGVTVVDTTVQAGTSMTDAQLVLAPPNTSGISYGAFVHSLGTPPSFAFAMLGRSSGALSHGITFEYVTADTSAVYMRAQAMTGGGAAAVRVVVVR
jgi:hypothetical protein